VVWSIPSVVRRAVRKHKIIRGKRGEERDGDTGWRRRVPRISREGSGEAMDEHAASPLRLQARSRAPWRAAAAARDGEVGDGVEPMWGDVKGRALQV
jgi:hypothetical protein